MSDRERSTQTRIPHRACYTERELQLLNAVALGVRWAGKKPWYQNEKPITATEMSFRMYCDAKHRRACLYLLHKFRRAGLVTVSGKIPLRWSITEEAKKILAS